jgi:hypothetical protein
MNNRAVLLDLRKFSIQNRFLNFSIRCKRFLSRFIICCFYFLFFLSFAVLKFFRNQKNTDISTLKKRLPIRITEPYYLIYENFCLRISFRNPPIICKHFPAGFIICCLLFFSFFIVCCFKKDFLNQKTKLNILKRGSR